MGHYANNRHLGTIDFELVQPTSDGFGFVSPDSDGQRLEVTQHFLKGDACPARAGAMLTATVRFLCDESLTDLLYAMKAEASECDVSILIRTNMVCATQFLKYAELKL
jgi:hypothetical protein